MAMVNARNPGFNAEYMPDPFLATSAAWPVCGEVRSTARQCRPTLVIESGAVIMQNRQQLWQSVHSPRFTANGAGSYQQPADQGMQSRIGLWLELAVGNHELHIAFYRFSQLLRLRCGQFALVIRGNPQHNTFTDSRHRFTQWRVGCPALPRSQRWCGMVLVRGMSRRLILSYGLR
ncbi:MAG: hypothetical protein CVV15_10950 [Gammaproteobacteria bacterium HGW-Gammaproteobacteria-5]|nr:MAG: hypothetical protein CVV15_10950 [Gammaproteobacteria bacterium HGW-Gammaproteobacteria-5]